MSFPRFGLFSLAPVLAMTGFLGWAWALKQSQAPPLEATLKVNTTLEGYTWLGDKNAPLTMVEYTDYQCPYCRHFHATTFEEIRKKYIDTGRLRFASRDLPLGFHANAFRAAEAARCAGDQGQFWKMRDLLSANPNKLSLEDITGYASSLPLNMTDFRACLDSGKYKQAIERDKAQAASLHITGTPSFIIGRTTPAGVDGIVVVGAYPFASFDAKLKEFESAK